MAAPDAPTPDTAITPDVPAGQTATVPVLSPPADGPGSLGNLAEDVPLLVEESRRGYKTTEFWAVLVAVAADIGLDFSSKDKTLASALVAVYAIARGIAKAGTPNVTTAPPA